MAKRIEVEINLLAKDKEKLRGELSSLEEKAGKLKEEIEALSGMWEGAAKETFMSRFAGDWGFLQSFFAEMNAYIQAMEYAQKEYQKCEDQVARIIGAIEI